MAALIQCQFVCASITEIRLYPTNIQGSGIIIKTMKEETNALRFRIFVTPQKEIKAADWEGYLMVYDGTKNIVSCPLRRMKLPRESHDVPESIKDESAMFEVVVAMDHRVSPRIALTYVVPGHSSVFTYWIYLKDFADTKTASMEPSAAVKRVVGHNAIQEPKIQQVADRLSRLRPGMAKDQVWQVLGKLPLEDKVLWISAGSDWGEGHDTYLLKHGYSLWLLWDLTDYDHYDWITGFYPQKSEGPYRRAWLTPENKQRIEF